MKTPIPCPKCGKDDTTTRAGKDRNGQQRVKCQNCPKNNRKNYTFTLCERLSPTTCPYCWGTDTREDGIRNDKTFYYCNECGRKFRRQYWINVGAMHASAYELLLVLELIARGATLSEIAHDFFLHKKPETIREWLTELNTSHNLYEHILVECAENYWGKPILSAFLFLIPRATLTPERRNHIIDMLYYDPNNGVTIREYLFPRLPLDLTFEEVEILLHWPALDRAIYRLDEVPKKCRDKNWLIKKIYRSATE